MQTGKGKIVEVLKENGEETVARISCHSKLIPAPGEYVLAHNPAELEPFLGTPIFRGGLGEIKRERSLGSFKCAPPLPTSWVPGTWLNMTGPIGRGFRIPNYTRRMAIIPLGDNVSRLLPLVHPALDKGIDVTLLSSTHIPCLPLEVEVQHLNLIPEILLWAEFLALEIHLKSLHNIGDMLGLDAPSSLKIRAQVLIISPMPCGGLADCGVCAVPAQKGIKYVCKDGPVIDLKTLDW